MLPWNGSLFAHYLARRADILGKPSNCPKQMAVSRGSYNASGCQKQNNKRALIFLPSLLSRVILLSSELFFCQMLCGWLFGSAMYRFSFSLAYGLGAFVCNNCWLLDRMHNALLVYVSYYYYYHHYFLRF